MERFYIAILFEGQSSPKSNRHALSDLGENHVDVYAARGIPAEIQSVLLAGE